MASSDHGGTVHARGDGDHDWVIWDDASTGQRGSGLLKEEALHEAAELELQYEAHGYRVRADEAGRLLAAAPVAPSRTAARLAGRFGPGRLAGIERGLATVAARWRRPQRRAHRPPRAGSPR